MYVRTQEQWYKANKTTATKGMVQKSWNADVQDFYPSAAAVHIATAVQYWEAAKKQKLLTTRCRKR